MKLSWKAGTAILVLALGFTAPAFAESRTTRAVIVTATVPVMIQFGQAASFDAPEDVQAPQAQARPRTTISMSGTPDAVTNQGASLTREWRTENGRTVHLYTSVVL